MWKWRNFMIRKLLLTILYSEQSNAEALLNFIAEQLRYVFGRFWAVVGSSLAKHVQLNNRAVSVNATVSFIRLAIFTTKCLTKLRHKTNRSDASSAFEPFSLLNNSPRNSDSVEWLPKNLFGADNCSRVSLSLRQNVIKMRYQFRFHAFSCGFSSFSFCLSR